MADKKRTASAAESSIERGFPVWFQKTTGLVKERDFFFIKLLPFQCAGLPDRMLLLPGGRIKFIEFKAPGGSLRPLQVWWRDRLQALGFEVYTIGSKERYDEVL